VLVRHENPQKFEPKWYGPYQIIEKAALGTYRLQDPNGVELAALIHGNRLINAAISTAEELEDLWFSPSGKDELRRRGIHAEMVPAYPGVTEQLNKQLEEDEGVPMPESESETTPIEARPTTTSAKSMSASTGNDERIKLKINLKRLYEQLAVDEAVAKRRKTATASPHAFRGRKA